MLTLIVMAGGMGSRFGGLKQLEPFGPSGEKIIDFTVYDAVKAGFDRVVFVIKEENLELFKKTVSDSLSDRIKVDFVFQSTDKLPDGFEPIQGREKPLGTGHAVAAGGKAGPQGGQLEAALVDFFHEHGIHFCLITEGRPLYRWPNF